MDFEAQDKQTAGFFGDDRAKARLVTIGWAIGALVLLGLLYYRVFQVFWPRWVEDKPYQHCALVPFIVGGLVWFHRERLRQLTATPSPAGLVVLGGGLLMCYLGYLTGARFIVGLSFPVVLCGLVGVAFGMSHLRVLVFPLLLFLFAVPFPRHILGLVAMPMQIVSSILTAGVTRLFGIPVIQEGVNIALPSFQFIVAEQCSGMNSLLSLFLVAGVMVELTGLVSWQKLLVYALTPVIAIAANVIRLVLSVVLLGELAGPDFALNHTVHGGSDVVVYLSAFLLVWGLCSLLSNLPGLLSEYRAPASEVSA